MGMPYSKQINAAFEQVTPLVAAGYQVLQTTKNISILLAAIQVLTVIFLGLILLAMLGLLISINPDLERERQVLVTPTLKQVAAVAEWIQQCGQIIRILFWVVVFGILVGGLVGMWYTAQDPTLRIESEEEMPSEDTDQPNASDIEAVKKGETDQ